MSNYNQYLVTAGISLVVSSVVVLANNLYLYKHACKKELEKKENKNWKTYLKISNLRY